jgi:nucleoside 2-deoxyribosyltransferase
MKRVYLGGPIHGIKDPYTWRRNVEEQLPVGWEAVTPLQVEANIDDANARLLVETDLAAIDNCHAVLAHVDQASWGTAMEIFYAFTMGIPVIGWHPMLRVVDMSPWLRAHCTMLVSDFKSINGYLEKI